ncbi:MAG: UDP-N-acetylglucosamine 1-carboxyvinyltransferase, partial [Alphaproteobacteria bacterium]
MLDKIRIHGGKPLVGEVYISGAKNAALPIIAACLASNGTIVLSNVPNLHDIESMIVLLEEFGCKIEFNKKDHTVGHELVIDSSTVNKTIAEYDIVRKMRASILVLGPLLGRFHDTKVSLPGGCAIGARPVDMHIEALKKMGAEITLEDGYIHAK